MVSEFLFYEEDANVAEKSHYIGLKIEIRELLRNDFNRRILTEILLDLCKDVSGDTQKKLFGLYGDLGLEKDAYAKLKSWRWEVVSKGISELSLMQVDEAYIFIVKFINDRRGTIRKQAEIAAVTLQHEGINYFLDTTKYKISEWQQLKLLDVLRNKEDFKPPRFKAWLTSTNKHVVLFALRLIKYYNQNDANFALIELVKHRDQQVKQEAIACIKEFYITAALPTLKGVFWKCTVDTKITILGAIAELGSTEDIEFLRKVSQSEGNFLVKSKSVGAINSIAPESILPTENIEPITVYQTQDDKVIAQNPNQDPPEKPKPMDNPKKTDKSVKDITESNELDFLPNITDEEIAVGDQCSDVSHQEEPESLANIEGYSLSDFEVAFEEKEDTPGYEKDEIMPLDLQDKSIIDAVNPKGEDVMSWVTADNELREIECQYETVAKPSDSEISSALIPQPVYYDDHEAYMMSLLDDLEELGDNREIPLLEELRAEESKSFIKDRISAMIAKFVDQRHKKKTNMIPVDEQIELPVFSVFADLFKSIDTDCKLILLDEIVPVGDEKEIEFLDSLLDDPNQKIRNKAQTVLKLLIAKLSHENPSSLHSKRVSAIVAEHRVAENISDEVSYGQLLCEMELAPALEPKIFDIDFDHGEVPDNNYDQRIFDIEVIATEVAPNEHGGSFLYSLRIFTKLFF